MPEIPELNNGNDAGSNNYMNAQIRTPKGKVESTALARVPIWNELSPHALATSAPV